MLKVKNTKLSKNVTEVTHIQFSWFKLEYILIVMSLKL